MPILFICSIATRALLLMLESTEKRGILVPSSKVYSKEETSSTASRSVFFWLTDLFLTGYKNILRLDDLYPLDSRLHSIPLHKILSEAWEICEYWRAGL
jgi:ATP-binding cassette, subfamily C (CFTR/MRP), member 1